jgi:phosphoglycolate phosphatase-like HAD superfamily hydrolase
MTLDIDRIQGLLFDVDGTLRDTDDHYAARFARIFRWIRPVLPGRDEHKFARRFVMAIESPGNLIFSIPDRLHLDDELAAIGAWMHRRGWGRKSSHDTMVPGTKAMLMRLSDHYPMAVVSARPEIGTVAFLDHFELSPLFKCVAHGQSAVRTKPFPDPVIWAAQQLELPVENLLMIGDTTVDIRAGVAAGTQTLGVLCGFGERDELEAAGADLVLNSAAQVADLLLAT